MNRWLLACSAALAASALAACGSDSTSSGTSPTTNSSASTTAATAPSAMDSTPGSFPNPPACAPLQVISQYDIESSKQVAGNDITALNTFLITSTPAVLDAYDQAAALEPDLADEIAILRKVSEGARDAAYEAKTMHDLQTLLLEIPEIQQAGTAAVTLNDYATTNCGFSTGAN